MLERDILADLDALGACGITHDAFATAVLTEPFVYVIPQKDRDAERYELPQLCYVPLSCERNWTNLACTEVRETGRELSLLGYVLDIYEYQGLSSQGRVRMYGYGGQPVVRDVRQENARLVPASIGSAFDVFLNAKLARLK